MNHEDLTTRAEAQFESTMKRRAELDGHRIGEDGETILITPTWEGTVGWYLRVLAGPATEATKDLIHADLLKLARWVDARQEQDKDDSEVKA